MKKILIPSILACILYAGEENFIEMGVGVVNYKDNFSVESNKNISTLGSAKSNTEAFPYVNFYYGYDLNESTNIYVTADMGDLNLGSSIENEYGLFDIGLKANIEEEWKNPFLTGVNRKKTYATEFGVYASYGFSLFENSESMIRYEFSKKSYDKDEVAKDLKRDGNRHILSLEDIYFTKLFDKETTLHSNLFYEKYDATGKASSYDSYGLELGSSAQVSENINLSLFANIGKKDYDKTNPVLNKKIDVDLYGVVAAIEFDKPFDYQNAYVSLKAGYGKEEANVNFYDKEATYGVVSVGYKF